MTKARWQTVSALFEEALATPAGQRMAFLKEACADDPALRQEVEALLEVQEGAEEYFEGLSQGLAQQASEALSNDEAFAESAVEKRLGAYRLVERIGGGGMGTIYRAERADGTFEQEVAVKVLRAEVASSHARQRFGRERQILASFQHPGIARVFDGGITGEGRPYLVMEYVQGQSLHQYCDERQLSIVERLHLLRQVCDAVQFAHQNLVVHRDLKSSNVLVTPQGQVKLVDFGIAKLLEEHGAEEPITRDGHRWLTPGCAAPEQFSGEPITTATDVYQLGLLAYRLLSGRRAFDLDTQAPQEVVRVVLNGSGPVAPSKTISEARDSAGDSPPPEALAAQRATTVERLRRMLQGDLDRIVLKALRREPKRRYVSAGALAEDLHRYQEGLPVSARADTWSYRLGKFVRRHRFGVAVALLLVLLCTGYAASMAWQMRQTARERDKAEELGAFMVDLFEVSDPAESVGEAISAHDLLARGAQQARSAFEDHPATRAMLLTVTGNIHRRLGLYAEADSLLREALAVRRALYGTTHPDVAESLHAMGQLRYEQGRYTEASPLLQEALAVRRRTLGRNHPDVATTLRALGGLQQDLGHYAEADSLFRSALAMRRRLLGEEHPDVAESLGDRAAVFRHQGRYQEAERYYREALRLHRGTYGETHLRVAEDLNNLAALLQNRGAYDRAESYARQSLQRYRVLFGGDHPDVAVSLSNLAYVHQKKGDFSVADSLYREALAMRRRLFGERHPHVANSLNNLAALLQDQGRYDEAGPLARRALVLYRKVYGHDHEQTAQVLTTLAWLKRNQGDLQGAETRFREALEVRRRLHGEAHPRLAKDLSYLAELLQARGRLEKAEERFRQALHILDSSVERTHPYRAIALTGLGDVLTERGRARQGEPFLREALARRQAALPNRHWRVAKTQGALGRCLLAQARYSEATSYLKIAYQVLQGTRGADDPLTRQVAQDLEALPEASRPGSLLAGK